MLHLLSISYDFETQKIKVKGYDQESRTFAEGFGEDHPDGFAVDEKDSISQHVLEILQALEGQVDEVYQVVSISEVSDSNPKAWHWDAWYRNKD